MQIVLIDMKQFATEENKFSLKEPTLYVWVTLNGSRVYNYVVNTCIFSQRLHLMTCIRLGNAEKNGNHADYVLLRPQRIKLVMTTMNAWINEDDETYTWTSTR